MPGSAQTVDIRGCVFPKGVLSLTVGLYGQSFSSMIINFTMPVFNRYEATQMALLALHKSRRDIPFTITVVDNGSEKRLVERLRELHQAGIIDKLFLLERNMGIACACNIGWEMSASADFYCKIDNDTMPVRPDWIPELFRVWRHGAALSNLGYSLSDNSLQKSVLQTPDGSLGVCESTLPGTGIFIPKAVSDILGYWNEEYGRYGSEDGDYGMRMLFTGFPQYCYYYKDYIRFDLDKKGAEAKYAEHGLNKKSEKSLDKVGRDGYFGRFGINSFLIHNCIRSPRVCRKYRIVDIDDNNQVRLAKTEEFKVVDSALKECRRLIMQAHLERGELVFHDLAFHEQLKQIMRDCGQDMESFNRVAGRN